MPELDFKLLEGWLWTHFGSPTALRTLQKGCGVQASKVPHSSSSSALQESFCSFSASVSSAIKWGYLLHGIIV